jgi:hypothetical protein
MHSLINGLWRKEAESEGLLTPFGRFASPALGKGYSLTPFDS